MDIKPMHVASFVKLMLKNRKNLDTMVKQLDELYLTFKVENKQMRLEESLFRVTFSSFNLRFIKTVCYFSLLFFLFL